MRPWDQLVSRLYERVRDVPGCVVECGVWKGGTLSFLLLLAYKEGKGRRVWGFDAFESWDIHAVARPMEPQNLITTPVSKEEVAERLKAHGWAPENGIPSLIEGLFAQSLPATPTGPIAFLHLDCDFYESYKTCLEVLWPRVSPGGIVLFDEYQSRKWIGARQAIDEYLAGRPHLLRHVLRTYAVKLKEEEANGSEAENKAGHTGSQV